MYKKLSGVWIMAYTTIDDPSVYFQTTLYTGSGSSTQNVVNGGNSDLQPDWVWVKNRTDARWHRLVDSSRGASKNLYSNEPNTEGTEASVTAFNSDGFSLGTDTGSDGWNEDGDAHVAWQWKANGGSRTTFNESGDNPGGGHQANTTAGFSIIDYTGTGQTSGDPALVPHGLGVAPDFIIVKQRDAIRDWNVFHHKNTSAPETDFLVLNTTAATADASNRWNDTMPNATNVVLGDTARVNNDAGSYIMYAFAEVKGFSKFGSYTGNGGEPGGPFVYTGFKPAWLMIHASSESGQAWFIGDNKRDPDNIAVAKLASNTNSAESAAVGDNNWDFLSNGFKIRTQDDAMNKSGVTFLYMAFAESPFVSSEGVPTTAR